MWQEINNLPYEQIIILILNLRHVHLESQTLTIRRGTECVSDIFKNSTRRFESIFCRSLIFLSVFEIFKIFYHQKGRAKALSRGPIDFYFRSLLSYRERKLKFQFWDGNRTSLFFFRKPLSPKGKCESALDGSNWYFFQIIMIIPYTKIDVLIVHC